MSIGLPLIGKVLAGAASGWLGAKQAKDQRKAEEQSRIDEEERRAEQYRGLGRPEGSYWNEQEEDQPKNEGQLMQDTAVGSTQGKVGQKYIDRAKRNRSLGPRYRFDEKTNKLSYG